ncbi:MAG: alpha/beta fold hydrolase [Actinomycetota bacterium]|nr:alpha/beta fold hydrolase [Actinomycetota bacterium]
MSAVRRYGDGKPLVALHGFTLTGGQFSVLGDIGREILAPDLPGHGTSGPSPIDPSAAVQAVVSALKDIPEDTPILGYSQGARVALSVATGANRSPSYLILISGTPGLPDEDERASRRARDAETAVRIERIGLEAFIEQWTSTGLTSTANLGEAARSADRAIRLENSEAGLASALLGYGQGSLPSCWHLLEQLSMPILILNGEHDTKYVDIGTRMTEAIGGNAENLVIRNAGHNPLSDQPQATIAIVSGFLNGHRGPAGPVVEPDSTLLP